MPRYDYFCLSCHETIEVRHKITDEPPSYHGGCSGKLARLWSVPGVIFRGTGWGSKP